ncbi:ABC transporter family protein [Roseiarcus fermentans]|uniref:ABC transporter family protein n=1 Tax=Roseiarcus fermentans TaxID=1473586 RepID=A0A366F5J8_9HYPH|nr:ATP-binding cassette domain-containing protein [Roseiarcus fermentans]RBP09922.1 ABC transporter family protein [Roseiarcus fermentans]
MSEEALLAVQSLSLDFESERRVAHILRDVSLEVPVHRHVALVGESGCGKSVTMRAVMGLLATPPAKYRGGEIRFDGVDLLKMGDRDRAALRGTAMSMVFQDPTTSLNPVFTIGDQMGSILKYADRRLGRSRGPAERKARIAEVLGQVRLADAEPIRSCSPAACVSAF